MIERQVVAQKMKEHEVIEFIFSYLGRISCSKVQIQRTPLGEKVIVHTSKPGVIVGKKGANIKYLTSMLKTRYKLENPQIEVQEITNPYIDAGSVARNLASGLQRFGPKRFKAMAYRAIDESMKAGARGIEIVIAGRGVPSERAHSWRFSAGYLKKSGDISENFMDHASEACNLKSGTVGIKVSILHPDVKLPDDIEIKSPQEPQKTEAQIVQETAQPKHENERPQEPQ